MSPLKVASPVEDLVDLGLERRLVGKTREPGEELAKVGALVAGQVHPDFAVHDRVLGHVPEHDGIGRSTREQAEGKRARHDHDTDDADGEGPAAPGVP
jgi:hypothetical protein